MNDKKLRTPIGAILLLIPTLISIYDIVKTYIDIGLLFGTPIIIYFSHLVLCIILLMKKRNIAIFASFSLIASSWLYLFFNFFNDSDFSTILIRLLSFIAYISLALISFVFCEPQIIKSDLSKFANILKKLYYVPALALIVNLFIPIIYYAMQGFISRGFSNIIDKVLNIVGILLIAKWIVDPYKKEVVVKEKQADGTTSTCAVIDEEAYCSLGKHIVLCLFTFGIWYLIWIHRTTKFLNKTPNAEQYNPTNKLLLCMFVPFYQIYWLYKHGQRIDTFTNHKGLNNSDMATLCLILGIFIPIVACILMQDRINLICTSNVTNSNTTPVSTTEELKSLKDLLDSGVITQEEFDAKKKQLLGL